MKQAERIKNVIFNYNCLTSLEEINLNRDRKKVFKYVYLGYT
jgi:hypothetical protein